MYSIGVLDFESDEHTDGFKWVVATVYVVAKEEVFVWFDILSGIRWAPEMEESHNILVLAVNISKYFYEGSVDSD